MFRLMFVCVYVCKARCKHVLSMKLLLITEKNSSAPRFGTPKNITILFIKLLPAIAAHSEHRPSCRSISKAVLAYSLPYLTVVFHLFTSVHQLRFSFIRVSFSFSLILFLSVSFQSHSSAFSHGVQFIEACLSLVNFGISDISFRNGGAVVCHIEPDNHVIFSEMIDLYCRISICTVSKRIVYICHAKRNTTKNEIKANERGERSEKRTKKGKASLYMGKLNRISFMAGYFTILANFLWTCFAFPFFCYEASMDGRKRGRRSL